MRDQYQNQQQRIDELQAKHGPCREAFMNDEAYLAKLESLEASKSAPKAKPSSEKKPWYK